MFDYSAAINEAKTNSNFFQPFAAFTISRTPDAISIDTLEHSDYYQLDVDTEALNKQLQQIASKLIKKH